MQKPGSQDPKDVPAQSSGPKRFQYAAVVFWVLAIGGLAVLFFSGIGPLQLVGTISQGLVVVAIGLVLCGILLLVYKTFNYVGIATNVVFRIIMLIVLLLLFVLVGRFVIGGGTELLTERLVPEFDV